MSGYQSLDEILADIRLRLGCDERNNVVPLRPEPMDVIPEKMQAWERSIPKSYRWAKHDAPELAERVKFARAGEVAREVADKPDVVFIGSAWVGKTSLAVSAFQFRRMYQSRFVHAYRLGTARIQHSAGEGEAGIVDLAMTMPLVLLDDVGNERQTATNAVPDVIFERHAAGLATWYTTAFEPADIAKKYGEGVARRLFERSAIIRLGGCT